MATAHGRTRRNMRQIEVVYISDSETVVGEKIKRRRTNEVVDLTEEDSFVEDEIRFNPQLLVDEIKCVICHSLPVEANQARCCEKIICTDCSDQHSRFSFNQNCPMCRASPHCQERPFVLFPSQLVRSILTNTSSVKCNNTGCREFIRKDQKQAHEKTCGHGMVLCKAYCGEMVSRKNMEAHMNASAAVHFAAMTNRISQLDQHIAGLEGIGQFYFAYDLQ